MKKYLCLECGHEQHGGAYCLKCNGTSVVCTSDAPPAGTRVVCPHGDEYISMGETTPSGELRVALPEEPTEYWGSFIGWRIKNV